MSQIQPICSFVLLNQDAIHEHHCHFDIRNRIIPTTYLEALTIIKNIL